MYHLPECALLTPAGRVIESHPREWSSSNPARGDREISFFRTFPWHNSILSRNGVSGKSGAVQTPAAKMERQHTRLIKVGDEEAIVCGNLQVTAHL
jgi:hypothetical protein